MNTIFHFTPPDDGWFHIAPHGTFPHPTGALQVIDAEACEAMRRTFDEEARQPNFPGLLVDFDHASNDPAQPTTAAGWIDALEVRNDGLYAQIRWSDLGHQALTGGRYRLASPVWNRNECDQWTSDDQLHVRPRRLDRLALTNDPNLPGMMPLSNRAEPPAQKTFMNLRIELLQILQLPATATDTEIIDAVRGHATELETLRNRCQRLTESQAEGDMERFADVITNRDVVRAQLLSNRDGTLALLNALRHPALNVPLHQPRLHRPQLHLLSPLVPEADSANARKIANRARQLQSQLKIGHHAAFRMAEGEADEVA